MTRSAISKAAISIQRSAISLLVMLWLAAPCYGQAVGVPTVPTNRNLLDIAQLADPNASRVLKWDDATNRIVWAVDATGGGGGGDVDAFAADPSSNAEFSAAAWISDLGLASLYQPLDADLTTWAGITPSANVQSFNSAANYAAMRALLTDSIYQPINARLTAISGLNPSANQFVYFTDATSLATATITSFARSLVDDADAATMRTTLGLVIGADVQAQNAGLAQLAALADPNADRILFWDDSAGAYTFLTVGSGLSIAGTTLTASGGGGGAPDGATYITQTPDGTLSAEQALSDLATGLLKNTTGTGVLSIATANTDYLGVSGGSPTFVDVDANIGTITASDPFEFVQTWNAGGVTFNAFRVGVTDTASASGSNIFTVLGGAAGSTVYLNVNKFGELYNSNAITISGTALRPQSEGALQIYARSNPSTVPGRLSVNKTFTNDTTLESVDIRWTSDVGQIGTVKGTSGGTARNLALMTDATNRWTIGATSGHLLPAADSTYNLGASGTEVANAWIDTLTLTNALPGSSVAAATTSAQGVSELAIASEVTTGSDATRAVTPDALRGSDAGKRFATFVCVGTDTALTTGDGKGEVGFRVPAEMNGWNLVGCAARVATVSSSGTPTFQIRRQRLTNPTTIANADMLVTNLLTIDANEYDSKDAATAATIDTSNDDVQTGDLIVADCDVAGTGAKGMIIQLVFQKP